MSKIFEVGTSSLEPGITLIEASAGTGKTFAIAGMVVRLVAEKGYSIGKVLVVTFTEAATLELRSRVRDRIRDAIILLESGRASEDPALANLDGATNVEQAVRHLRLALLSFDEAAIFTIHGFCQRVLQENAFETGAHFDVDLLADARPIWQETAEDFWRNRFYKIDSDLAASIVYLQNQNKISVPGLVDLLSKVSRNPNMILLPNELKISLDDCLSEVQESIQRIRVEWANTGKEVSDLLAGADLLKKLFPVQKVKEFREMLSQLNESVLTPNLIKNLDDFASAKLEDGTKKKNGPITHRFFDLCGNLAEALETLVRVGRREFIATMDEGLEAAKKRRRVMTFDDLLTRLYKALKSSGGKELATAVGRKFEAALIDEFQDTDPVQWEIFYQVFGTGNHLLYLIGDPKQAIYSFRGADIFTYLEARSKAKEHFTLGKNWRSEERLVHAANQIFTRHENTFVFSEIPFTPVEAAKKGELPELDLGASSMSADPMQLICVSDDDDEVLAVGKARDRIHEIMVGEIHRLLTDPVTLNGRKLEPGDIAILTRKNREAEDVRKRLGQSGIPAVIKTDRSVLQTDEAEEMVRLLSGISEPHRNGLVKTALASSIFGYTVTSIHELDQNEDTWQALLEKFYRWQQIWHQHGFIQMFRKIQAEESLRVRLLGLPDGERLLTNFQHIAECLHTAEHDGSLTPTALVRWLREQKDHPPADSESHVLRLEKDDKAVQIVTIHRSKGLEYPVVFCPFSWTSILRKNSDCIFHDPKNGNQLTWDMNSPVADSSKAAFEKEQMAEAIRLLYVAITRARSRCYLFWAATKETMSVQKCAFAHAFGCGTKTESASTAFTEAHDEGWAESFTSGSSGARYVVGKQDADQYAAAKTSRELPQAPLVTSFSGLTAQQHEALPDYDALSALLPPAETESPEPVETGPSIFTFPKGAKAGNFFHELLENLDFTKPEQLPDLTERFLKSYRFDSTFAPIVIRQLTALLNLPLPDGFSLSDIANENRLVEASFHYPLRPIRARDLVSVFKKFELPEVFTGQLGRLKFAPVDGYMTGFIDLIVRHGDRYYIIDWKSNWLGGSSADYRGEALQRAMSRSYYQLQYHLYTVALHRFLSIALPDYCFDEHFGGVYYVFLRGIDNREPESGIFQDRPSKELIGELSGLLAEGAKQLVEVES